MTGFGIFIGIVGLVIGLGLVSRYLEQTSLAKDYWNGPAPHPDPITFLNAGMAIRPTVLGHSVPMGYRQACRFFGVGLIDRTGTLDHGFDPQILDPIPKEITCNSTMAELCAQRAASIVEESRRTNMSIRLLWSGGIDSTCAAVALLDALEGDTDRLEVAYSNASQKEYPKFYKMLRKRKIRTTEIHHIAEGLDPDALIVTGEHGDQIFGSMLAADIPFPALRTAWRNVIPQHIEAKIGAKPARAALDWMEPQLAACPVPVDSTYDFLWWANFSMKWQTVSQRVLAALDTTAERRSTASLLRHFFQTDDFQRWSLANPDQRIGDDWASYKFPLKDIIFDFNRDKRYRKTKIKERSLRGLTGNLSRRAVAIDKNGQMLTQAIDRSLLPRSERWFSRVSVDWE